MKPDKLSVYQLFESQKRHVVPLFQRPYVWEQEKHWEPLWEDIVRQAEAAGRDEKVRPHFLGAVVLNQLPSVSRDIDTREIIDGQQRMTTLQLFLAAARHLAVVRGYSRLIGEFERLTINPLASDSGDPYKIRTTRMDHEVFSQVMLAPTIDDLREALSGDGGQKQLPRLAAGYEFFLNQLSDFLADGDERGAEDRFWSLYTALRDRLQLVVIDLEETDDPQIIFETLNARGVPLLPSDLIRNFVLHRARIQGYDLDSLYEKWWRGFDENPGSNGDSDDSHFWKREVRQGRLKRPRLDLFFFHFLQHESMREFNITRLYQEFCEWWDEHWDKDIEGGLARIQQTSGIFAWVVAPQGDTRADLFLNRLETMDTSTLYPLLLAMLGSEVSWSSDDERVQALIDIESFLVRRMVCRLTNKNYNKFFLALLRQIKTDGCSLEVIQSRLLASDEDTARWPDDREFRRAWSRYPVYGYIRQDRVRMILEAIEMQLYDARQERLGLDTQTSLEHVMPQQWEVSFPLPARAAKTVVSDDGETQLTRRQRLVHTFGNLTLLTQKLNSSISNGTYTKKRKQIVKQSVLKLNTYFQEIDSWNEEEIERRGNELFKVACQVWPRPSALHS